MTSSNVVDDISMVDSPNNIDLSEYGSVNMIRIHKPSTEPERIADDDEEDDFLSQGVADLRYMQYPTGQDSRSALGMDLDCQCGDVTCQLCGCIHVLPGEERSILESITLDSSGELLESISPQSCEQIGSELDWHFEQTSRDYTSMDFDDMIPEKDDQFLGIARSHDVKVEDLDNGCDIVEVDVTVQQIGNREIDDT